MNETKRAKPTRAELARKIVEIESQLAHVYHFAEHALVKAGTKHMTASGVVLRLTALGGREIISPVCIRGGLSDATIEAIRADLARSYADAIAFKPKGA